MDLQQFETIAAHCKVCRLGLSDEQGMMIVPMNFGYEIRDDKLLLYFHSRMEGRKIRALRENPGVCFEMDCGGDLAVYDGGTKACDYGTNFVSAMGTGTVAFLEEPEEKRNALALLACHQTGRRLPVPDRALSGVAVFRLDVQSLSLRRHRK